MTEDKITFDRFVRWMILISVAFAGVWLLGRLSGVLLPFFVAWFLSYMLYPLVRFLQYKAHLRSRILSIVAALLLVLAVLAGFLAIILPPLIEEVMRMEVSSTYISTTHWSRPIWPDT